MARTRIRLIELAVALGVALVAGRAAAQSPGGSSLNTFQCYEVRPPAPFTSDKLDLVDRFGEHPTALRKTFSLCAPADLAGDDPTAPMDPAHLTAYGVRSGNTFQRVRGVTVMNEFHTLQLDLVRPARYLVPSTKGLTGPPSSPVGGMLDDFLCYKVKRARGEGPFGIIPVPQVTTQFESAAMQLVQPRRLCAPVDENGQTPGAESHTGYLLCYRTRVDAHIPPRVVFVNNEFGQQQYGIATRRELCVVSQVP